MVEGEESENRRGVALHCHSVGVSVNGDLPVSLMLPPPPLRAPRLFFFFFLSCRSRCKDNNAPHALRRGGRSPPRDYFSSVGWMGEPLLERWGRGGAPLSFGGGLRRRLVLSIDGLTWWGMAALCPKQARSQCRQSSLSAVSVDALGLALLLPFLHEQRSSRSLPHKLVQSLQTEDAVMRG